VAAKPEGSVVRLIRYVALGVPTLAKILAVALIIAAIGVAFFDIGAYDEESRAMAALLFAAFALLALGVGFAVPFLVRRLLP
jgi:hypothetical protein